MDSWRLDVTVELTGYVADAGSGRTVQGADGWTIATRDRSLAAHYEDTIVITRGRPVVLTGAAA